jgi:hypothetical protein
MYNCTRCIMIHSVILTFHSQFLLLTHNFPRKVVKKNSAPWPSEVWCWSGRGEGKLKSECGEPHDIFTFEQNCLASFQDLIIVFLAIIPITVCYSCHMAKNAKKRMAVRISESSDNVCFIFCCHIYVFLFTVSFFFTATSRTVDRGFSVYYIYFFHSISACF